MNIDLFKEIALYQLDDVFYGPGDHGPVLMKTLESLSLDQALFENREGYGAWKIALHCAYWKHYAACNLDGVRDLPFERSPDDFPDLPRDRSLESFGRDLELMKTAHERMKEAVRRITDERLGSASEGENRPSASRMIFSIIAHDAYHTAHIRNLGIPGL